MNILNKKINVFKVITSIIVSLVFLVGGLVWADNNGVWHRAEDVVPGLFGGEEDPGIFTFPGEVVMDGKLNINSELIINSDNSIFNGNVTINGNLQPTNICLLGECHSSFTSLCSSWVVSNAIN